MTLQHFRRPAVALGFYIGASFLFGGLVHAGSGYGFDFCPIPFGQMFGKDPGFGYGPAYGRQYRPRTGWGMGQVVTARIVDENGDGVISDDEAAARYEEDFAAMDVDRDSMLSNDEYMAARMAAGAGEVFYGPYNQQVQDRQRGRFQTLDADADGKVSQSEFMIGSRERFQGSDLDKDGKVTAWEFRSRPRL